MGFDVGNFLKNVAATAGHALGAPLVLVVHAEQDVAKVAAKIPIVGPLFHGILGVAAEPFALSKSILDGERIDHALVDSFKRQIGSVRDVAPYAQAVISFVPGVGQAASSAIGAGLAIAEGLPADEVAMAAVAGAIPGGAIALAGYKMGRTALVTHKLGSLSDLAGALGEAAGVPIPSRRHGRAQRWTHALQAMANGTKPDKALLAGALQAAPGIAKGVDLSTLAPKDLQGVADKLIAKGQDLIPHLSSDQRTSLKNALHTGIAMQHAQNLQRLVRRGMPGALGKLQQAGQSQRASDPVARAAKSSLQGAGSKGFDVGLGLMHRVTSQYQASATRANLSPTDQHGFDTAAALQIGRVTSPDRPLPPAARAGRAIVHGLRASGDPAHRVKLMRTASALPDGRHGAAVAASEIKADGETLFAKVWHAFRSLLGLEHEAKEEFFKAGDELAKR